MGKCIDEQASFSAFSPAKDLNGVKTSMHVKNAESKFSQKPLLFAASELDMQSALCMVLYALKRGSRDGPAELTPSADGTGTYCCGHNKPGCCGIDMAFKIPSRMPGIIGDEPTPTPTPRPLLPNSTQLSNTASIPEALCLAIPMHNAPVHLHAELDSCPIPKAQRSEIGS
ncbi:hypothetical protein GGS21DRAFT_485688 [Xylaria nigripes]|nr:hypothetical protein GGS21DRAFT_485688 [Xylaria nigripes]